jgi:hypothetical protein
MKAMLPSMLDACADQDLSCLQLLVKVGCMSSAQLFADQE